MTYARYKKALGDEPLPAAIVDLDAVDRNVDALLRPVRAAGKTLRLATKSVRCPGLVRYIVDRGGGTIRGLMTYTASETHFWATRGERDLLLAYPTVHPRDVALLAETGAAVVADDARQLDALDAAGRERGARIPIVIEVDVSYRPLGVHIGVRRSPLRTAEDVAPLVRRIGESAGLRFHGLMVYEAHVAGVADTSAARRIMKARARVQVERTRRELADALHPALFNGGGTGSLLTCSSESALTEVTAGSGFLDSHLFDHYDGLTLAPASFFALQIVRVPGRGFVTCHGGGYIASGAAGDDRLPRPALPPGASLLSLEGAGEVQTPLAVPEDFALGIGDPVFFRHAKAGELAEHFGEYLLVRDDRIESRAPTYRGLGHAFLG